MNNKTHATKIHMARKMLSRSERAAGIPIFRSKAWRNRNMKRSEYLDSLR